jgi:hypothetical protein
MKIFILTFFFISHSYAYTIVAKPHERYANPDVHIFVSTKGCEPIHRKPETVAAFIQAGVSRYWNSISTSPVRFKVTGFIDTDLSKASSMEESMDHVAWNSVVVACNDRFTQFVYDHGGLGLQSHFQCNEKNCRGLIYVNATTQSMAKDYDDFLFQGYLAYSLGKTLGIGGSRESNALMYYYVFRPYPEQLHQDDIAALTYLYPGRGFAFNRSHGPQRE